MKSRPVATETKSFCLAKTAFRMTKKTFGAEREAKPHNDEQLRDAMAEELTTGGRP